MKKNLVVLCVLLGSLAGGLAFGGGSTEPTLEPTPRAASEGPEPLTLPIVDKPMELTTFVTFDPTKAGGALTSYAEMACYEEMARLTNITMKFVHPPAGQQTEQFNLMVSSGQFPDIIEWGWINYPGGPEKAIQDGVIIPLNELIDQYAPNLKRVLEENPDAKRQVMTDSGLIYCFPFLRLSDSWRVILGFQVRESWLKKAELQVPKTLDDWYTMLVTFKNNDMNGNGDTNDELPFMSLGLRPRGLAQFASAWGIVADFYRDGDEVKYGPAQSVYRDYVTTMSKWYSEGLIDPDFISTDQKQYDAKIAGELAGSWYGLLSGHLGRLTQLVRRKDPSFKILGASRPIGPAGKPYDTEPARLMVYPGSGAGISTSNKHVRETMKFLDYGYSPEGHLLMVFGIEGVSYRMVNGEPVYTEAVTEHPKLSRDQAIGVYARGTGSPPLYFTYPHFKGRIFLPDQHEAQKAWATGLTDLILPPVTATPDEGRRLASLMSTIDTYVDEMTAKFIMGREPLGNFDAYLDQLNKLGVDEAVSMKQSALERYMNR
jgi:putative aldouronate transport system substrate-binding protein